LAAVIGVDDEGVGAGGLGLDVAFPLHGEVIVVDDRVGRAVAPVVIDDRVGVLDLGGRALEVVGQVLGGSRGVAGGVVPHGHAEAGAAVTGAGDGDLVAGGLASVVFGRHAVHVGVGQ